MVRRVSLSWILSRCPSSLFLAADKTTGGDRTTKEKGGRKYYGGKNREKSGKKAKKGGKREKERKSRNPLFLGVDFSCHRAPSLGHGAARILARGRSSRTRRRSGRKQPRNAPPQLKIGNDEACRKYYINTISNTSRNGITNFERLDRPFFRDSHHSAFIFLLPPHFPPFNSQFPPSPSTIHPSICSPPLLLLLHEVQQLLRQAE